MNQNGKVLFFNANDGNGIIITCDKEKVDFSVRDWNDFEIMPSLGLKVKFTYENNTISDITAIESPDENETVESKDNTTSILDDEIENKFNEPEEEQTEPEVSDEEQTEPEVSDEEQTEPEVSDEEQTEPEVSDEEQTEPEVSDEEQTEPEVSDEEHFSTDDAINVIENGIEDLQDEIGEQKNSLTLTLNINNAVTNYFNIIKENVDKRKKYVSLEGRLDYLTIRRFLWTTFNNISEIDLHIITPKIKALSDDLKQMAKLYDDFIIKTKHPKLAYEEVFLSCQAEYLKIRNAAEKTIQRLSQLKNSEKHLGGVLKIKKADLQKQIDTAEFDILKEEELKSLNGTYVDVVHMMAELDERYKSDMKLLIEFEAEYKKDFNDLFLESAVQYKKVIIDILSAQAFLLDTQLWNEAKASKAVAAHFRKAGIRGELNTKTYLKYYLDSQDSAKAKGETQKLFQLYEYLCAAEKDFIMIVVNDANDAMEFESYLKKLDKKHEVKAFLDEKKALQWAMRNSIKVLIVEDRLAKMSAEAFLKFYHKYIVVNPQIITLGNVRKSGEYIITKMVPKGISSRGLGQQVQELFATKK